VTITEPESSAIDDVATRSRGTASRSRALTELARLHFASRRGPAALAVFIACAAVFQALVRFYDQGTLARQVPAIVEAAAAGLVSVSARSPFGESERATGRWLPFLRLAASVTLSAAAFAMLAAGSAGVNLLGGELALLRNLAGMVGVGLLAASVLGGYLSWLGPIAYLALTEEAISSGWQSPWTWPARPADDVGAAICAAIVFCAGLAVIAIRGARTTSRE
jgi:hypothetical protein